MLELSSFQIEQLARIQKGPKVALLTNLTLNHLDRYGTFATYCGAKENIFKFQQLDRNSPTVSIFNAEDEIGAEWFEKYKRDTGRICIKFSVDDVSEEIRDSFPLPGRANLSNLAAAIAVARHFGVENEQIKTYLPEFRPLPHRLELVAEINGAKWYNDSKATTPQSAIASLEAFEQPVIIIAGGYDKNLPFDELGEKIAQKAKAAILIGETAKKIAGTIEKKLATENTEKRIKVEIVDSLAAAVGLARELATNGDVVLLSPACASYDMFDNFEHRGREFCRLVRETSG
ncbi:UDP-N-acetylmuramoylalanine--D-glutamate ligase [subsurface metagenome]